MRSAELASSPPTAVPMRSVIDARSKISIADLAQVIAKRRAQLRNTIAEAAYLRAQQRGFAPGHEVEDWLAAKEQILGQSS